jgi:hypothetical protein
MKPATAAHPGGRSVWVDGFRASSYFLVGDWVETRMRLVPGSKPAPDALLVGAEYRSVISTSPAHPSWEGTHPTSFFLAFRFPPNRGETRIESSSSQAPGGLELCRVDLPAAVSKHIGETEKNLRRIQPAVDGD